jgi:hypothetical protein
MCAEHQFKIMNLKSWVSYIFPFAKSEIYFDLKPSLVCGCLTRKLQRGEIELREGFLGSSKKHFTGSFSNNVFELTGPSGNKEWPLITRGTIQSHGDGTVIYLSFNLITFKFVAALVMWVFYCFYRRYSSGGHWKMWETLAAEVLFFYMVMICFFHYQIPRIKNWLKEWVNE